MDYSDVDVTHDNTFIRVHRAHAYLWAATRRHTVSLTHTHTHTHTYSTHDPRASAQRSVVVILFGECVSGRVFSKQS